MANNGLVNLDKLFKGAADDGLTNSTIDLVVSNLNGPTMTQTVGVGLDELGVTEVTLAMNIIDMSGSMTPHAADLMQAFNEKYLRMLVASPAADDILISTILFDDRIELLNGFVHPEDADKLTDSTYRPRGSTALYDAIAGGITNTVLYTQQLRQSGISVRTIFLVYTDGQDNTSKQRARDIKRTVTELYKQEIYSFALVAFVPPNQRSMGFNTGTQPDPVQIMADDLGFREGLAANLNPADLGRLFHMASQSTVQVSQGQPMANRVFT
ncbi:MAG: VWA domain-containing protein [Ardenticatenaceae bacterium]|nr:VWA domain-containing protein [Ardenticatenaceae bacterium]